MAKSLAIILILISTLLFIAYSEGQKQTGTIKNDSQPTAQQRNEPEQGESQSSESEAAKPEVTEPQKSRSKPAEAKATKEKKAQSKKLIFGDEYAKVLGTYVDENGLLDYGTLRRKRIGLINTVKRLEHLHPAEYLSWPRNEQLAFWINAYNLCTIQLIIDEYPIQPLWYMITYPDNSIKQIPKPWSGKFFKMLQMEYTLKEIEKEVLLYKDLRACWALSYASMSSALLRNEPYYADRLDEQLDDQVRKYLARATCFRLDDKNKTVYLSDLFNWYRKDFINSEYAKIKRFRKQPVQIRAYLNFILKYVSPDNANYLMARDYTVGFQKYDWRLNEQPNKPKETK